MAAALAWLQANWVAVVAPLLIALFDFVMALKPEWKANGLFHWLYLAIKGDGAPKPQ
jgi:hypothetical protein